MRRTHNRQTGIRTPALIALFLAVILLLAHRAGGSVGAARVLDRLATSQTFVAGIFSAETGAQSSGSAAVHAAASPSSASYHPTVYETGFPQTDSTSAAAASNDRPRAVTVSMNNESGLSADPTAMLSDPISIDCSGSEPTVLIYHTHATEAYTPSGTDSYKPSGDYRTTDTTRNVVRVGSELKQVLESRGISVIHLTELFDHPSYNGSYGASLAAMKKVLAQYPTIQVTIDIHRDAVILDDGSQYRTEAAVSDSTVAQLMLVVGTDASGLAHPDWQKNLNFAANLQADLSGLYPNLMRPINLRRQRFNEHLCPGGLLLEVGSSGNTLQEALDAVRLFGNTLADRVLPAQNQ